MAWEDCSNIDQAWGHDRHLLFANLSQLGDTSPYTSTPDQMTNIHLIAKSYILTSSIS